ncbi:MAG: SLC13 family permease [Rikenellaceae bacterium]
MDSSSLLVILGIFAMLLVLSLDKMRPGFTIFSVAIFFMAVGIITPKELVEGFSNKEMITVAMLFLIGEGVRQSGSLGYIMRYILPQKRGRIGWMMAQILPVITMISTVLNNTAVVIIFAPMIKRWADKIGVPATKFLIPLSYATIFGGVCTLVGTSTNMVVNGMMIEAGYRGFSMFEIGKVGVVIAVVGIIYLIVFGNMLLPGGDKEAEIVDDDTVEVILAARYPGVGKSLRQFNFQRHYGVKVIGIVKNGNRIDKNIERITLVEGDTLLIKGDDTFIRTWSDSSAFHIVSYGELDQEPSEDQVAMTTPQRWLGMSLLIFLIGGCALGEFISKRVEGVAPFDIFSMAAVTMVVMAIAKLFPTKRYTKYISWDILIAIASAFAISKAMSNSGINEMLASWIINTSSNWGNYGVLALLFLVTMLLTEFITNNAAVAISFPIANALGQQLGIDPMPLFVGICIAASASFSSPIGYQTNLIVQGVGGYKFKDYLRVGIWLNLLTFIISIILIPLIWEF